MMIMIKYDNNTRHASREKMFKKSVVINSKVELQR